MRTATSRKGVVVHVGSPVDGGTCSVRTRTERLHCHFPPEGSPPSTCVRLPFHPGNTHHPTGVVWLKLSESSPKSKVFHGQ